MGGRDFIESEAEPIAGEEIAHNPMRPVAETAPEKCPQDTNAQDVQAGVLIGELIAITDGGNVPLVLYPGQPSTAAIRARTVVDLHGPHIGRQVVLMFEGGDSSLPIIMGVLRGGEGWPLDRKPREVEVDVNGERMVISAKEQLVLRCGKASITLTNSGKVLINGSYLLSRSSGVNCIKGGSVQLN